MNSPKSSEPRMEVAAEDTTFKGVIPKRVWLCFSNMEKKDRFTVTLEVNGISKVISDFYIPGLSRNEGITSQSDNLTWLFAEQNRLASEVERLRSQLEFLRGKP